MEYQPVGPLPRLEDVLLNTSIYITHQERRNKSKKERNIGRGWFIRLSPVLFGVRRLGVVYGDRRAQRDGTRVSRTVMIKYPKYVRLCRRGALRFTHNQDVL